MSQSSAKIRLENVLILTGCSIALSTIILSLSPNASYLSYLFTPAVAFQTFAYHCIILILPRLPRFRSDSLNPVASPYPHSVMRPAIGLAGFLCLAWLTATGLSIAGLLVNNGTPWWRTNLVIACIHLVMVVLETAVMVAIMVQAVLARRSIESEQEGGIQI
jgi:hypothetical protein